MVYCYGEFVLFNFIILGFNIIFWGVVLVMLLIGFGVGWGVMCCWFVVVDVDLMDVEK